MAADAVRPACRRLTLPVVAIALWAASMGAAFGSDARVTTGKRAVDTAPSGYVWHDGATRRVLRVDASLQADFSGTLHGGPVVLHPIDRMPKASAAALRSPVLRDEGGRARALPGGVVVVFAQDVDDVQARRTLAAFGTDPVRPVSGRTWLVASAPGLAALELAERLAASGVFASAQPNWWVERVRK